MADHDDDLRLYLALVDQIQKYNTILWQVPTALMAANLLALDRFANNGGVLLVLAIFDAVLIFAFYRLVQQQSILIRTSRQAEKALSGAHAQYVPAFPERSISARWLLVGTLVVGNLALVGYAGARWGWLMQLPVWFSRQHAGLVLTVAGTVLLAFSVGVSRQYKGKMARIADDLKDPTMIEPTETRISRPLFWGGLVLVAVGTLLQW